MQHIFKKTMLAASLSLVMAPAAYATNGLAPTGLGQLHKAMGGASVGNPLNTTSIMSNPAAASFVPDGYDVGIELFKPNRTVKNNIPFSPDTTSHPFQPGATPPFTTLNPQESLTPGTSFSGDKLSAFVIPEFAYKKDIGKAASGNYSVGLATYGNGGMNTSFANSPAFAADALSAGGIPVAAGGTPDHVPDSVFHFNSTPTGPVGTTGVDLKQVFISPTISTKINENHSVGFSLNFVAQQFQAKGLSALSGGSTDPTKFTDKGKSTAFGVGATIGWMGKINDNFTMGASYRMKTKMGKFEEYAGLFPDQGRMDVPASLTIGVSTNITPDTIIAVDVNKIYYSKVNAIGNPFAPSGFGSTNGPGFGWDDQTIFKIGLKTQATPKLAILGGYNHGKSPVGPEDTFFNALTPATVEDHISLGFEYKLSKNSALTGSYTRTFENEVKGNPLLGQQFDISMDQDAVGIGYSRTF